MVYPLTRKIKRILRGINFWIKGTHSLNYVFACNFYRYLPWVFRSVTLPNNIRVYVNDEATLFINIPDMYERREYFQYDEFVPRIGWTVIDIGAYVGIFSLYASKAVGAEGLVLSFEPNPLAYYWLVNNIRLNKARNVFTFPVAIGDISSKMQLYVAKENVEASSLIAEHITQNPAGKYTLAAKFNVPVTTLDEFLEKCKFLRGKSTFVRKIDLVKIDVEGYELKVLKGAKRALKEGLIKRLVIEVHIDRVSAETITKYLEEFGFHIVGIERFGPIKDMVYAKAKAHK